MGSSIDNNSSEPEANEGLSFTAVKVEADLDYCVQHEDEEGVEKYPLTSFVDESESHGTDTAVIPKKRRVAVRNPRLRRKKGSCPRVKRKSHNKKEAVTCPICEKTYYRKSHLQDHIRCVHEDDPVDCDECGKRFKNRELMKIHYRRIHVRGPDHESRILMQAYRRLQKNHKCSQCSKKFNSASHLQSHIKIVHDDNPVDCEECGKKFKNQELHRYHYRRVHINGADGTRELRLRAASLPNSSNNLDPRVPMSIRFIPWEKFLLPVEMRTAFIVCDICTKSFKNQDAFIQHSKSHKIEDNTWKCELCSKHFRTERHLNKHRKKVHKIIGYGGSIPIAPEFSSLHVVKDLNAASYSNAFATDEVAIGAADDDVDHFADDWIENNEDPESQYSSELTVPSAMSSNSIYSADDYSTSLIPATQPPVITDQSKPKKVLSLKDLMQCPKLKMGMTVSLKKFKPMPRPGHVFCDICCQNFVSTYWLQSHMDRIHQIVYTPKKKPHRIAQILAEMRGNRKRVYRSKNKKRRKNRDDLESDSSDCVIKSEIEGEKQKDKIKNEISLILGQDEEIQTEFPCTHCGKICASVQKMRRHISMNHGDTKRTCHLCKKVLINTHALNHHMKQVHHYAPTLCDICGKRFNSPLKVKLHKMNVHCEAVNKCKLCDKSFKTKMSLRTHFVCVHEKIKKHQCDKCPKAFTQKGTLRIHLTLVHKQMDAAFPSMLNQTANSRWAKAKNKAKGASAPASCDVCGKLYSTREALKVHKVRTHLNPGTTINCPHCNKSCKSKYTLRGHISRVHRHQDRKFSCNQCDKVYKDKSSLDLHFLACHKPNTNTTINATTSIDSPEVSNDASTYSNEIDSPLTTLAAFQCEDCGKRYKTPCSMREHRQRVHVQEDKYRCLFCNFKTKTSAQKRVHELQYHGSPHGFGCKICDQFCESSFILEKHVSCVHSLQILEELYYEPAQRIHPPAKKIFKPGKFGSNRYSSQWLASPGTGDYHTAYLALLSPDELSFRKERREYGHSRTCGLLCGHMCPNRHVELAHIAGVHPTYAQYRCEECQLAFGEVRLYNVHMEEVHNVRNERSSKVVADASRLFGCNACPNKYFMTAAGLAKHEQNDHKKV